MQISLSRKQKVLLLLFFAVVFIYSFNPIDTDTFYHLKVGQVILQIGAVPHTDIFSYTAAGSPWIAHEWLAEVIFYLLYTWGGFALLLTAIAAVAVLAYYFIFRTALKKGASFDVALIVLLWFGGLTFNRWIARPQVFSYLACALLIYCLEAYLARTEERPKIRYLLFAILSVWFWANINGSVPLGLAIFFLYALVEIAKKVFPSFFGSAMTTKELAVKEFWYFIIAAIGALAIAFINPNTYNIFLLPLYMRNSLAYFNVQEWKPIYAFISQLKTQLMIATIGIGATLSVWWFGVKKETRNFAWLGLVLGASVMPFIAIRLIAYWPMMAGVPIAYVLSRMVRDNPKLNAQKILPVLAAILAIGFLVAWPLEKPASYTNSPEFPIQAANFIEATNLQGPFFNLYNQGAYLIWRFWPSEKVSMDGRSDVYQLPALRDYNTIIKALPAIDNLVNDKYQINYFILEYQPPELLTTIQPLVTYLIQNHWPLVYWDNNFLIFVRNNQENQAIIKEYKITAEL